MTLLADLRAISSRSVAVVALCVGVQVMNASLAEAQMVNTGTGSQRPYRALFGGAAEGPRGNDSLIFSAAAFGGYDDDIFARGDGGGGGGGSSPNRPRVSGTFLGSQMNLGYRHNFRTANLTASAATANRYVIDTQDYVTTYASGAIGLLGDLNARTSYQLQQNVGYRPFYTPVVFPAVSTIGPSLPGELAPPATEDVGEVMPDDFTLASDREGIRYASLAQLQRRITQRSSVQARGAYMVADFASRELDNVDNQRWRAGATYSYDLTRYLSAQLGYNYRSFNSRAEGVAGNHDINVGLLFNRPFRVGSGQTIFTFTTGSTVLKRERLAGDTSGGSRVVVRAIGTANLAHAFTRSWLGNIGYAHTVGYVDGLSEPVEGDRVVATLAGLIGPSVDVSMSAGYVSGAVGLRERNFNSTYTSARLRFALHTRVALFAQYFYYHYSYKDGVADEVLASPEMHRQGVRVGVNLWLPLIP